MRTILFSAYLENADALENGSVESVRVDMPCDATVLAAAIAQCGGRAVVVDTNDTLDYLANVYHAGQFADPQELNVLAHALENCEDTDVVKEYLENVTGFESVLDAANIAVQMDDAIEEGEVSYYVYTSHNVDDDMRLGESFYNDYGDCLPEIAEFVDSRFGCCFDWDQFGRELRLEGTVTPGSDGYFLGTPYIRDDKYTFAELCELTGYQPVGTIQD